MKLGHHVLMCAWKCQTLADAVSDSTLHVRHFWSFVRHGLGSEVTLNEQSWSPVLCECHKYW